MEKVQYRSFDVPTQVAFWDFDGEHWTGGIAYGDTIICGCCGGIVEISEVYEFAPADIDPLKVFSDWVDLSLEIIGYGPNSEDFANLGKPGQNVEAIIH